MLASDNPLEVIAEQEQQIRDLKRALASARAFLLSALGDLRGTILELEIRAFLDADGV